jgi:hypothetical protein
MSREKHVVDQCTIPLSRGQRTRWQAAAQRKSATPAPDLADWIIPLLDAAADYERAVGRSAAELLRLMVPVPLRPLLHPGAHSLSRNASSPSANLAAGAAGEEAAGLASIVVPTVGVTALLPSPQRPSTPEAAAERPAPPEAKLAGS